KDPSSIAIVNPLPSYPDDEGDVVLCDKQGNVIDEVIYNDHWHFALISNKEGIAIERLDPDGSSDNAANWHSAASTAGFGTPGYHNSQYPHDGGSATVSIEQKSFSPDNDGH